MYVIFWANIGKENIYRLTHKGQKSPTFNKRLNNSYFLFSVYSFTCVNVFFVNTLCPASSPRMYMKEEYLHPLILSGFGKFLNKTCRNDQSANSFPSGHVAETLCIAFAYFGMGKKNEGYILLFCCINVALATLFLRYHYFVDILCAVAISLYCFLVNYYFGYRYYLKEKKTEEESLSGNRTLYDSSNIKDSNSNNVLEIKIKPEVEDGNNINKVSNSNNSNINENEHSNDIMQKDVDNNNNKDEIEGHVQFVEEVK